MSTKTNFILDLMIFLIFLVVASPSITGVAIHEWLALSFAAAIVTHLLLHWTWLVCVTKDFFKKLWHSSHLNYVVDVLFFVAMTAAMFSGVMISKSILGLLGIQLGVGREWRFIHSLASDTSIILLGIHFGLHWRWVVNAFARYLVNPLRNLIPRPAKQRLAVQKVRVDRDR